MLLVMERGSCLACAGADGRACATALLAEARARGSCLACAGADGRACQRRVASAAWYPLVMISAMLGFVCLHCGRKPSASFCPAAYVWLARGEPTGTPAGGDDGRGNIESGGRSGAGMREWLVSSDADQMPDGAVSMRRGGDVRCSS